jgi:hypothetical protein
MTTVDQVQNLPRSALAQVDDDTETAKVFLVHAFYLGDRSLDAQAVGADGGVR